MYRHTKIIDNQGEIISESHAKIGSKLKEGWIVMYKEGIMDLVKTSPNYATLKVYLLICAEQDYNTVTYITTSYVAKELNMAYQTAWNAIKWLVLHQYIKKVEIKGNSGFVVNPLVSTCGVAHVSDKLEYFKTVSEPIDVKLNNEVRKLGLGQSVSEISDDDDLDDGDRFAISHHF